MSPPLCSICLIKSLTQSEQGCLSLSYANALYSIFLKFCEVSSFYLSKKTQNIFIWRISSKYFHICYHAGSCSSTQDVAQLPGVDVTLDLFRNQASLCTPIGLIETQWINNLNNRELITMPVPCFWLMIPIRLGPKQMMSFIIQKFPVNSSQSNRRSCPCYSFQAVCRRWAGVSERNTTMHIRVCSIIHSFVCSHVIMAMCSAQGNCSLRREGRAEQLTAHLARRVKQTRIMKKKKRERNSEKCDDLVYFSAGLQRRYGGLQRTHLNRVS